MCTRPIRPLPGRARRPPRADPPGARPGWATVRAWRCGTRIGANGGKRLERELAAILPRLVDDATERILLFGSAARGDLGSASDLDLLVVRRDERRSAERADDLYRRARASVALDLLVFTPEELAAAREASSFVRRALREGRVVYERSST